MRRLLAWAPVAVVCAIAVARSTTVRAPPRLPAATEADKRAAFWNIASREPQLRRDSVKDFPTDHWSQDDAFHSRELGAADDFARSHRVPRGDVLQAIDDGMRERWSGAANAMIATVPPCQPRAIY
jgi:hypothetical protein